MLWITTLASEAKIATISGSRHDPNGFGSSRGSRVIIVKIVRLSRVEGPFPCVAIPSGVAQNTFAPMRFSPRRNIIMRMS